MVGVKKIQKIHLPIYLHAGDREVYMLDEAKGDRLWADAIDNEVKLLRLQHHRCAGGGD